MANTEGTSPMTLRQAEIFARGLYYLANVDGIDERELAVIREFLDEVGQPELFEGLAGSEFDAVEAAEVLETSFLRRVFLKAAIVLIRADGAISEEELDAIQGVAWAFQLGHTVEQLLVDTEGMNLD